MRTVLNKFLGIFRSAAQQEVPVLPEDMPTAASGNVAQLTKQTLVYSYRNALAAMINGQLTVEQLETALFLMDQRDAEVINSLQYNPLLNQALGLRIPATKTNLIAVARKRFKSALEKADFEHNDGKSRSYWIPKTAIAFCDASIIANQLLVAHGYQPIRMENKGGLSPKLGAIIQHKNPGLRVI